MRYEDKERNVSPDSHAKTVESSRSPDEERPTEKEIEILIFDGPQRTSKMGARETILKKINEELKQKPILIQSSNPSRPEAEPAEQTIQKTQQGTRFSIGLALGMSLFAVAGGTTIGYFWVNKLGPFAEKAEPTSPQDNQTDNGYEYLPPDQKNLPENLRTPDDLQAYIDTLNLHPGITDFEQVAPHPQAQALFLRKKGENYMWRGLNQKITEITDDTTIVAVQVNNKVPDVILTYEGLQPVMVYKDKSSNISFLAYDCHSQPKKGRAVLGQITVRFRGKAQWFRSINIGRCQEGQYLTK